MSRESEGGEYSVRYTHKHIQQTHSQSDGTQPESQPDDRLTTESPNIRMKRMDMRANARMSQWTQVGDFC